jgi:L-fuconolactonase
MWNRRQFLTASAAAVVAPSLFSEEPPTLLIDSHVHVWKHAFPFASDAHPPTEDAAVEQLLDLMHANHVLRTVLIQVIHYRWDNRYLASVLKRYSRTFQGVCRVNPQDPAAPDHLSRLSEVDGFHGVRLSPSASPSDDWIRGPLMPPLWRRCAQLKIPMTLLTPVTRLPDIEPLIEQHPDLTVVIDHMADCPINQPDKLNLLLALARYPRVFVKISHMWSLSAQPYPYADTIPQIKGLCKAFGPARLMWGTDWPISLKQLSYPQAVALYRDHLDFLSPADRAQILYKTVQRVWPFGIA